MRILYIHNLYLAIYGCIRRSGLRRFGSKEEQGIRSMTRCPLCNSPAKRHLRLGHSSVWECAAPYCGLQFAMPQLEEEQLRAAYTDLYYPDAEGCHTARCENTPESVLTQGLGQIDAKFGPLIGKEILDYGCGAGSLSHVAIKCGARPVGVEPNPNARKAIRRAGLFPAYGSLEALQNDRGESPFDFIFLWEVIEHLREPWRELAKLRKLLRPGGRIVISTPNASGLRARLLRRRWHNYTNPTHFYYFAPASLRLALGTSGFEEIVQLHFAIRYPDHGAVRSAFHRVLLRSRLDGELLFTASPGPSESLTHGNCSK